jgi:endonuclease YncB( thermonuclease family)
VDPALGGRAAVTGAARVVDGDTILVGEVRVRLEGIDAPEIGQTCYRADGAEWRCGDAAAAQLARMTKGREVRCDDLGADRYGRTLGRCIAGSLDINAEMVRLGLAWAFVRYSRAYVAVEAEARALHLGIWQGKAVPAWEHRSGSWAAAEPLAPNGCAIKGNVSAQGHVYHMPWSPWYAKVNMDGARGKRWFCSEAEAIAAGWRPASTR